MGGYKHNTGERNTNTSTSPRPESSTTVVREEKEKAESFNQRQKFGNKENGIQIKLGSFSIFAANC